MVLDKKSMLLADESLDITQEIIKRLNNDDDYYGDFGKQYLSNSDITISDFSSDTVTGFIKLSHQD